MGYLKTKLSIFFKDYNSLSENNLLKLSKEIYNSNPSIVNESLKKCKISMLKIILTILSIFVILISLYFLHVLIYWTLSLSIALDDKYFPSLGQLDHYIVFIYIATIPSFALFYLFSCFNITIRKSKFLRILTIIALLIWIMFFYVFFTLLSKGLDID